MRNVKIYPYPISLPHFQRDPMLYLEQLKLIKKENTACNFSGMLFFTSLNDAFDQWMLGAELAIDSDQIPVFAVLPYWEHPIITARRIVSFQQIFQRPIGINWITGVGISDFQKIDLSLSKEARYERLGEYIEIVYSLLNNNSFAFEGVHFKLPKHHLRLKSNYSVMHFLSGASEYCDRLISKFSFLKQISMGMNPGFRYGPNVRGIGVGVITRPTETEALNVFRSTFPMDRKGEMYFQLAQNNTDSVWKKHLSAISSEKDGIEGFFTTSLKNYTELGFIVGDYRRVAKYFKELIDQGMDTFFVNLTDSCEVAHLNRALQLNNNLPLFNKQI